MLVPIAVGILVLCICIAIWNDGDDILVGGFFGIFGGVFLGIVAGLPLSWWLGTFAEKQWVLTSAIPMHSYREQDFVEGGRHRVRTVRKIVYFRRLPNENGLVSGELRIPKGMIILQEDRADAEFRSFEIAFKEGWVGWFVRTGFARRFELHVPRVAIPAPL